MFQSTVLVVVASLLTSVLGTVPPIVQPVEPAPVRHLTGIDAIGKDQKPIEITTEEDFARHFGEEGLKKIKGQVDFTTEKVLWVTWTGSSSSSLDFTTTNCKGQLKVKAYVYTPELALTDHRPHGGLLVMPKEALWSFGG